MANPHVSTFEEFDAAERQRIIDLGIVADEDEIHRRWIAPNGDAARQDRKRGLDGTSKVAADAISGVIATSSLPHPVDSLCPSYGAAHDRPVLALSRRVGTFHVDFTTFKLGMTVRCKHTDARGRSCGWFPGVISRIVNDAQHADIEYDDGSYDYGVPFKRLRLRSDHTSRVTFNVSHIPAPFAIVLSIPHARQAVAQALQLIHDINSSMQLEDDSQASLTDDDEVEFVMERVGCLRGSASCPIVL